MFLLNFLCKIWIAFRSICSFLVRAYPRSRAPSSAGSKADGLEKAGTGDIHIASDVSSTTLTTLNGSFEEANLEAGNMTPAPKSIGMSYYLPTSSAFIVDSWFLYMCRSRLTHWHPHWHSSSSYDGEAVQPKRDVFWQEILLPL